MRLEGWRVKEDLTGVYFNQAHEVFLERKDYPFRGQMWDRRMDALCALHGYLSSKLCSLEDLVAQVHREWGEAIEEEKR